MEPLPLDWELRKGINPVLSLEDSFTEWRAPHPAGALEMGSAKPTWIRSPYSPRQIGSSQLKSSLPPNHVHHRTAFFLIITIINKHLLNITKQDFVLGTWCDISQVVPSGDIIYTYKNTQKELGEQGLWVPSAWVQISALPLSSHETLNKFCNYSVPLFLHP